MEKALLFVKTVSSPIGKLFLLASRTRLKAVLFEPPPDNGHAPVEKGNHPVLLAAEKQLKEYFRGRRKKFDVPLDPEGTDFQKKAWRTLAKIPFGKTISYGLQAKLLGDPAKARAVGGANANNPIPIIIPCHRVIAGNGRLAGYAGGIGKKEFLLRHEGSLPF